MSAFNAIEQWQRRRRLRSPNATFKLFFSVQLVVFPFFVNRHAADFATVSPFYFSVHFITLVPTTIKQNFSTPEELVVAADDEKMMMTTLDLLPLFHFSTFPLLPN